MNISGAVNPASGNLFEALRKKRAQGELSNPVMENVTVVNETTSTGNVITPNTTIRPAYGDTGGAFKRKQELERGIAPNRLTSRAVNEGNTTKRVVTVSGEEGIESCLIETLTTTPSSDIEDIALTLLRLYKNNPNVFTEYDFKGLPVSSVIDLLTQFIEDLSNVS